MKLYFKSILLVVTVVVQLFLFWCLTEKIAHNESVMGEAILMTVLGVAAPLIANKGKL